MTDLLYDPTGETDGYRDIAVLSQARQMLAEARTLDEIKGVRDMAEAMRLYAKKAQLGLASMNEAAEVKLLAERRAGAMLAAMEKQNGSRGNFVGRDSSGGYIVQPPEALPTLEDVGVNKVQSHRWQKVANVPAPVFERFVERVKANVVLAESGFSNERLDPLEITTNGLLRARHMAVHKSSEQDDWLTPGDIIERSVRVLGAIDLGPCSNRHGPPNVPATGHYLLADDALHRPWLGRVYMNPPYGSAIGAWTAKLHDEHEAGHVTAAIALVPARTDTEWWLAFRDAVVCFIRGRLQFSGSLNSAPFPSVAAYLGADRASFVSAFDDLGDIWARWGAGT